MNHFWLAVVIFFSYFLGGLMARRCAQPSFEASENRHLKQYIAILEAHIKGRRNG